MEKYKLASESRGNEMKKTVNGAELNCVTVGSGSPVLVMHGGLGLRWVLTEVESVTGSSTHSPYHNGNSA